MPRTRGNQYKLELKRDGISDKYSQIVNAPCFIEKGTIGSNDEAIYNSENMAFNQIKTEENLLKDATGVGWIVGYFDLTTPEISNIETEPTGVPYRAINSLDD